VVSPFIAQVMEQSDRVSENVARETRAREAAEARATEAIVRSTRVKILLAVARARRRTYSVPHRVIPSADGKRCVRCSYPLAHEVHTGGVTSS
jgi:hypothetical protein